MAEVLDICECERRPLRGALTGAGPFSRALLLEGGQAVHALPLLWPVNRPEIEAHHSGLIGLAPDVELHVAADALVGGPGAHVRRGNAYLWAAGACPGYVRHWMRVDWSAEWWAFEPTGEAIRAERVFCVLHYNLIYGHWLTEMLPKLFVIARLREQGVSAPIAWPSTAPAYLQAIVNEVLPGQELLVYDPASAHIAADRVLLPGMMQQHYLFHPGLLEDLERLTGGASVQTGPPTIFVSRSALPTPSAFRTLTNAAEVESLALDLGLVVVHPEQLPWREQVGLFAGAELIVGEFGSGLHNAIFSPAGTRVVALNWINEVQSRIAAFRGHDLGYILDPDGEPRIFSPEPNHRGFRIDPDEFARRVSPLVPARRSPGWRRAGLR
ncbi:MAG: glycosyltransferase 61 family protein [Pseudomonadota bacterium]|nr:glycosyltransferase 61 family protein [Pseudomonadota bacterium]